MTKTQKQKPTSINKLIGSVILAAILLTSAFAGTFNGTSLLSTRNHDGKLIRASDSPTLPYWEDFESNWSTFWTVSNSSLFDTVEDGGYGSINNGALINASASITSLECTLATSMYGIFATDFKIVGAANITVTVLNMTGEAICSAVIDPNATNWELLTNGSIEDHGRLGWWYNLQMRVEASVTSIAVDGEEVFSESITNEAAKSFKIAVASGSGAAIYLDNVVIGEISTNTSISSYPGSGTPTDPKVISGKLFCTAFSTIAYTSVVIDDCIFLLPASASAGIGFYNCEVVEIDNVYIKGGQVGLGFINDDYNNMPESAYTIASSQFSQQSSAMIVVAVDYPIPGVLPTNPSVTLAVSDCECLNLIDVGTDYDYYERQVLSMVVGLSLFSVRNVTLTNNQFIECGIDVNGDMSGTDLGSYSINTTNKVNKLPVIFMQDNDTACTLTGYSAGELLFVNCSNKHVEDYSISGGSVPVKLLYCSDSIIHGVRIDHGVDNAFSLDFCENITIDDCFVNKSYRAGVSVRGCNEYNISHNWFIDCIRTIRVFYMEDENSGEIHGNYITATSEYLDILETTGNLYMHIGMQLEMAVNVDVTSNVLTNQYSGIQIVGLVGGSNSENVTVVSNYISACPNNQSGYENDKVGISTDSSYTTENLTIVGNEIVGFDYGIYIGIAYQGPLPLIENNSIHDCTGDGAYIANFWERETTMVMHNQFENNEGFAIGTGSAVNITENNFIENNAGSYQVICDPDYCYGNYWNPNTYQIDGGYYDSNPSNTSIGFDWLNDPDGDGLTNLQEDIYETDVNDDDTDNDGLSDGSEVCMGLDPSDEDTDNDRVADGTEIDLDLDPLNHESNVDGWIKNDDPDIMFRSHDEIRVWDNSFFTEEQGVVSGSGSAEDPYIFEGWVIYNVSWAAILIWNTDAFFVLRQCIIKDESSLTYGIYLYNCSNARIEDCYIEMDSWFGMVCSLVGNASISSNIYEGGGTAIYASTMTSTDVFNNTFHGQSYTVQLNQNTIGNTFYQNDFLTSAATTDGSSVDNHWNCTNYGNYWYNYETLYPDADNDGTVWDTPYSIYYTFDPPTYCVNDEMPLVSPGYIV